MRTVLRIICIISASISSGNCIICVECSNNYGLDCVGNLVTCGTCMTNVTMEINGTENATYTVKKTCALNLETCNVTYSLSSGNFKTNHMSSCCDTDYCNNNTAQVPPRNDTENGVECPSCDQIYVDSCVVNGTVRCTGSETKCLKFTGQYVMLETCQPNAFQGCVTENVCEHPDDIPLYPKAQICGKNTLQCSAGNSSAPIP
ncbi:uncharacterized protein LOC142107885 [Mixophyes fleayi]|uniref:uncharacterized protein LOC142107885 n=1 Tax=Mixophyes fleayi TaxID=3061075 RepID=UPI003F4D95CD